MRCGTRLLALGIAVTVVAVADPAPASGAGYAVVGGTPAERAEVRRALAASRFDWRLVPARVTIHLREHGGAWSEPGHVHLDRRLLRAGRVAWAMLHDEYAHQLDFFVFDDEVRARLTALLGGRAWCRADTPGLRHADYACERFTSTFVWAYWPSRDNPYRPLGPRDGSAAMEPAAFRRLVAEILRGR
ncbi:MAG TPA: hypothetical protein VM290_11760 [Gaiellaceae bacterium]|nr:hypothetical protein [Gaiellaceae bacterium]